MLLFLFSFLFDYDLFLHLHVAMSFNLKGKISRECSKDGYNGTWMEPSYISCTREKIAILEKKVHAFFKPNHHKYCK